MANFLLILFCLGAGFYMRRAALVASDAYKVLNTWVIYVGLPAVSFLYLPTLQWENKLLFALLAPLLVLGGSVAFMALLARILGFSKRTAHTLMLISGLSNTSFVGFPLVASYFGTEYIKLAIISDQMTFFLLSSVGIVIAIRGQLGAKKKMDFGYMGKRLFTFPPLIACVVALTVPRLIDITVLNPFFTQLAATVSPIALFSIGMQLSFSNLKRESPMIMWSLAYKLLLAPLFVIAVAYSLGLQGDAIRVASFEMAMPSLVATSMVLQQFKLNTGLGNAIIGISILLGLISSFFMHQLILLLL